MWVKGSAQPHCQEDSSPKEAAESYVRTGPWEVAFTDRLLCVSGSCVHSLLDLPWGPAGPLALYRGRDGEEVREGKSGPQVCTARMHGWNLDPGHPSLSLLYPGAYLPTSRETLGYQ